VGASAAGNTWDYANSLTQVDMQAKSAAAASTKVDVDGAGATVAFDISGAGAVTQAATAVFIDPAGVGAAKLSTTATTAATVGATATTTLDYYVYSNGNVMTNSGTQVYKDSASAATNPSGFTLTATSGATATANALSVIDAALAKVDGVRGALGAVQNRFDSVISNLGTTVTNLSASRSRIQDANYATEVSNMTRAQILQQAGTSVLAQANQTSQGVLSLLR
jgi:flagellin